jgi:ribosomal protein S18 acetylase RimI-like enzyme
MNDVIVNRVKVSEVGEVFKLMSLADEDYIRYLTCGDDVGGAMQTYLANFHREDVYFSHKNFLGARQDNRLIGCVLFFKGEDENRFESLSALTSNLPRESNDDEIYIDSLAVDPHYRGRGIARKLVQNVIDQARAVGLSKVGLMVDIKKPGLIKMYEALGFAISGKMRLLSNEYQRMTLVVE